MDDVGVRRETKSWSETLVAHAGREFRFVHDNPNDHVFSLMARSGVFYESDVLAAAARFLKPGDRVLDVGANMGSHTVFFAGVCDCDVIAFEPNGAALAVLRANIAANKLKKRVAVKSVAIGAKRGRARLVGGAADNLGTVSVEIEEGGSIQVRTLDDFAGVDPVSLIKIDVEGFELSVLNGAQQMLERDHPVIIVEARERSEYLAIQALLNEWGYIPAGSYGFTPTHMFVDARKCGADQIVATVGKQCALQSIAAFEQNEQLSSAKRWIGDVHQSLRTSQGTISSLQERLRRQHLDTVALKIRLFEQGRALEKLSDRFDAVSNEFGARSAAPRQAPDERTEFNGALEKRIVAMEAAMSERSDSAATRILEEIAALRGEMQSARTATATQMAEHTSSTTQALSHEMAALHQHIDTAHQRLMAEREVRDKALADSLTTVVEGTSNAFGAKFTAIASVLDNTNQRLRGLDQKLASAEARETASIDMQLRAGSLLESRIASVQRELKSDQERLVENALLSVMREQLEVMRSAVADSVGRQLAQFEASLRSSMLANFLESHSVQREDLSSDSAPSLEDGAAPSQPNNDVKNSPTAPKDTAHQSDALVDDDSNAPSLSNSTATPWAISAEAAKAFRTGALTSTPLDSVVAPIEKQEVKVANAAPSASIHERADAPGKMPQRFAAPDAREIGSEDFLADASAGAWAQSAIQFQPDGMILCREAASHAGVVSRRYTVSGGCVIEVEVESRSLGPAGERRILRLVGDDDDGIGHDVPLADGVTIARAYVPQRLNSVKIYVLAVEAKPGPLFTLVSLKIREVDGDAHQRAVSASIGEAVYASMASIPSRRDMLRDAVGSLLVQCDRVSVFLNNYPDVPAFLNHPRIEICRSQDWDDRGDAGKVFWLERDRSDGGYRLIVDDDLIFPPDFATVMTAKVAMHEGRAIYAVHGVLLRQPVVNYYSKGSRAATFHFARELKQDRGVHIGATNALCLHSSAVEMRWHDFKYCNSADIWLSLYAQECGLAILTPARSRNWVRENRHAHPDETIYHHSQRRTRTRFDSSFVQDAVLRRAKMITLQTALRRKVGVAFVCETAAQFMSQLASFTAVRSVETEWIVMLAFNANDAELRTAIETLAIEHETHVVNLGGDTLAALNKISGLHRSLGAEITFVLAPGTRFANAHSSTSVGEDFIVGETIRRDEIAVTRFSMAENSRIVAVVLSAASATRDHTGVLKWPDGTSTGLRLVVAEDAGPDLCIPEMMGTAAAFISTDPVVHRTSAGKTVNAMFERVLVLNLDRRPDRWERVSKQLQAVDVSANRFSAIDGASPAIRAEFEAYARQPIHTVSDAVTKVVRSSDLYHNYASQMTRIAYIEQRSGKKAIESPGAWGYMRSYEAIIERALTDQVDSLLVFDDDVVFHKDFKAGFAAAVKELPKDWLIVQLGTLQYNWSPPWVDWCSPHLYRTNGSAIGSHAVGMRFDVLPSLLDHVKRMDLPFDIGALSAVTRAFPDRCYVIYPNLVIQSLSDSDISTSAFQKTHSYAEVVKAYRWKPEDYCPTSTPVRQN